MSIEKYLISQEKKLIKQLKEAYNESLEIIEARIIRYNIADQKNFGKKRLSAIRKERLAKQKELKNAINKELLALEAEETKLIEAMQDEVYEDMYYQNGFLIAFEVSQITGVWGNVGHVKLNKEAIRTALTDKVANKAVLKVPNITKGHRQAIQTAIRKEVAKAIATGISEKELTQIISNIDKSYSTVFANAQATARTEVFRAQSFAYYDSVNDALESGVIGDEYWDSVLDSRTRPDHRKMNGQRKKKKGQNKGYFVLPNGERARYPRDENLSGKQSINCRCLAEFRPFNLKPTSKFWTFSDGKTEYDEWVKGL